MTHKVLNENKRNIKPKREHADYRENGNKQVKELDIAQDFLEDNTHKELQQFVLHSLPNNDPPDVWLLNESGIKVALEITELVNQDAIHAQINKRENYSIECEVWSDFGYFRNQINSRIQEKQRKCSNIFSQGHDVQLLFHTDEGWLEDFIHKYLDNDLKLDDNGFSRIWLMLSYSPSVGSCPVISLL